MRVRKTRASALLSMSMFMGAAFGDETTVQLEPIHAGYIADQNPFDGLGDAIDETGLTFAGLTSGLSDCRATVAFDVGVLQAHRRIRRASLLVTRSASAYLNGTTTIPIQLFSFAGESTLQLEDFNRGWFVDVFEGLVHSPTPISLNVTAVVKHAVRQDERYLGFSMRTNVHGSEVVFGGAGLGYQPMLVLRLES
jgi:hypothetical protein